jgi:hypothetical protein
MDRTRYAALKSHIQDIALQLTKITGTEWTLRRAEADETTYYHLDSGTAQVYITEAYNAPNRIAINGTTPRGKDRQYVQRVNAENFAKSIAESRKAIVVECPRGLDFRFK